MDKQYAINRKAYLERMLSEKPNQTYMGDSSYAEDSVEQENRYNDMLENKIKKEIKKLNNIINLIK